MPNHSLRAFLAPALLALATQLPSSVAAQTIPLAGEDDNDWRYAITGYLFAPALTKGSSTVAGVEADLELNLNEILELLEFALSGRGEAWRGNWGFIADFYTVKLGIDSSIVLPGPAAGDANVKVDVNQKWVSLLAAYRFAQGTHGADDLKFAWDFSFGARWNSIKQEIDAKVKTDIGPGTGRQTKLGGTEEWWEPMVGLRAAYQVSERWTLGGRAELGGFGVNGDKLQYTVLVGADWRPWERTSLKFGYQFYGIDFSTDRSDGDFAYDVSQHGPYLGITFRF